MDISARQVRTRQKPYDGHVGAACAIVCRVGASHPTTVGEGNGLVDLAKVGAPHSGPKKNQRPTFVFQNSLNYSMNN